MQTSFERIVVVKTAAEIADSISQNIAHIFLRPSMHVGSISTGYSANSLDVLLFTLHYQWAYAHGRAGEFREIVAAQHQAAKCGSVGFADAFRHIHNGDNNEEASRFVMRNWREISQTMGLSLDDGTGRNAMDVEL